MNPAEIQAELREHAPAAPDHLRTRVQTIVAGEGAKRRAFGLTPRRLSLVAVCGLLVAAVGAAFVHGLASDGGTGASRDAVNAPQSKEVMLGAARGRKPVAPTETTASGGTQFGAAQADSALKGFGPTVTGATLPPAVSRYQEYEVSLGVKVKNQEALSKATTDAMRWTRVYGGYVAKASYATPNSKKGQAELVLRIPVTRIQDAIQKFSSLGTLSSQHVEIQDLQGTVNAQTKRIIQLNRRIGAILAALQAGGLTVEREARLQAELVARKQELAAVTGAKRQTVQQARLAHVYLTLHTAAKKKPAAVVPHTPNRIDRALHDAGRVLAREVAIVVYGAIVLAPFALLAFAALLVARTQRRRSERRLLASS